MNLLDASTARSVIVVIVMGLVENPNWLPWIHLKKHAKRLVGNSELVELSVYHHFIGYITESVRGTCMIYFRLHSIKGLDVGWGSISMLSIFQEFEQIISLLHL